MPFILKFSKLYFQFLAQQVLGAEGRMAQNFRCGHKDRLVVDNDARLRREADLAAREGIERIDHLVGRHALRQVDHYFDLGGRIVVHFLDLDFALLVGLQNAVNQYVGGDGVGQFGDDDALALLVVVHLGADAQAAALSGVVVARHVDEAAGREVGINLEGDILQYLD